MVAATRSTAGAFTPGPDQPLSQNWFTTGASQLTRNVRPQIPVTDTTCTSGRDPYCEYAVLPAVPKGLPIVPSKLRRRHRRREHQRPGDAAQPRRQPAVDGERQRTAESERGDEQVVPRPVDDGEEAVPSAR